MKKFSKILSLVFTALILMSAVSFSVFCEDETPQLKSGTCGANVTWELNDNGVLTISGKGEISESPWLQFKDDIKSVVINNGITIINVIAFSECTNFESITIPKSVTVINGDVAVRESGLYWVDFISLSQNIHIKNITVDNDNKNYSSVDGVLFNKDKTKLICYPKGKTDTSYSIPNSVTSINHNAFNNCINLKSITIPNSVTSIGDSAFYDCTNLENIIIPNSITSIGENAFYNTSYYENTDNWDNGVFYLTASDEVTKYLIATNDSFTATDYSIKDNTKVICNCAFRNRADLKNITIPNSVAYIGHRTFDHTAYINNSDNYDSDGVLYLTASDGVTKYLISTNDSFTATDYSIKEGTKVVVFMAFADKNGESVIISINGNKKALRSITIPDSVICFDDSISLIDIKSLENINVDPESQNYLSEDGVLFNKDKTELLCYPQNKVRNRYYEIPESVTYFDVDGVLKSNNIIRFHGSKDEWNKHLKSYEKNSIFPNTYKYSSSIFPIIICNNCSLWITRSLIEYVILFSALIIVLIILFVSIKLIRKKDALNKDSESTDDSEIDNESDNNTENNNERNNNETDNQK